MFEKIRNVVNQIKKEKPLILNITNDVTMDFIANGLLSLGASPLMSKAQQEIDELVQLANSVVINLGTLDEKFIALSEYVCDVANQFNKPIILDPVGAGASKYRTNASLNLITNYDIAITKGNASEIMSLSEASIITKGVDSTIKSHLAIESAQRLSANFDMAVVVSGEVDIVVDGKNIHQLTYGSPFMAQITGAGCLLSAILSAFHAIEINRFDASVFATAFYGICGENAGKTAHGPASFKVKFLDELSSILKGHAHEK